MTVVVVVEVVVEVRKAVREDLQLGEGQKLEVMLTVLLLVLSETVADIKLSCMKVKAQVEWT